MRIFRFGACSVLVACLAAGLCAQQLGDERAMPFHLDQNTLLHQKVDPAFLYDFGLFLFQARFTSIDGAGRPGATGAVNPTRRPLVNGSPFVRTSGPDANACAGCHNLPRIGGGGDFATNVFVGAAEREPVLESISPAFSAERRTPSVFGGGLVELLAREMTSDLHAIRRQAMARALREKKAARAALLTKGVSFGFLTVLPDQTVLTTEIEGIDKDLVVRPWSQKGVVTSLRTFTVTALNQHHGMQSVERFGMRRTGSPDFARGGSPTELSEGDVTALVIFQASLPVPKAVLPKDQSRLEAVQEGKQAFASIGCAGCHIPSLPLRNTVFEEPGPYNLDGTLRQTQVASPYRFDLSQLPWANDLQRDATGAVLVEAFTDLKRHRIADAGDPYFANEVVSQGFAPTDQFLTKRLWECGSFLGSYGHRGDVTTLDEVIRHHAGEARKQRLAYENLVAEKRAAVIEFLKTMQTPAADLPDPTYHQLAESLAAKVGGVAVDSRGGVYGQFVERAEAAAIRAERTTAHIRSQARRIEYELERAELGVDRNAQTVSLLPAKPSPTSHRIAETLVSFNSDENIQRILSSLARAESAMIDAFEVVKPALIRAARAGASEQPARVGHIQAEAMISNLNDLNQHREFEKILIELVAWCDDVAFRTEQIGQQTDLAEMRVEAFASYHQQNSRQIANPIRNDLQENSPR